MNSEGIAFSTYISQIPTKWIESFSSTKWFFSPPDMFFAGRSVWAVFNITTPVFCCCYCLPEISFPVLFILSNPYSCISSMSPYTWWVFFFFNTMSQSRDFTKYIQTIYIYVLPIHFFISTIYICPIFHIFLTPLDLLPNWSRVVVVTAFISFSLSAVERYTLCYLSGYI